MALHSSANAIEDERPQQAEKTSSAKMWMTVVGSATKWLAGNFTRLCIAIDRVLVGRRWKAILGLSSIGMLTGVAHMIPGVPAWPHKVVLLVFLLLVVMLAWAYVADVYYEARRSDEGAAPAGWGATLRNAFAGFWEMIMPSEHDGVSETSDEKQRKLSGRLFGLSVTSYTLASLVVFVFASAAKWTGIVQFFSVLALAVSVWLWWKTRGSNVRVLPQAPAFSPPTARSDIMKLPPIMDLKRGVPLEEGLMQSIGDPVLRELLRQLPRWTPGERGYEKEYEQALVKFIKRTLPGVDVTRQVYVTPKERYRVDVVLDGRIAIELKKGLSNSSSLNSCIGQIRNYAKYWEERGPLLLLICNSTHDYLSTAHAQRLVEEQVSDRLFRVVIAGYRIR
ncbi:MAG: hypothetical protein HC927_11330 [Deltaproteobacteria bacterium]|nr:hypothetical protein [Deltaproteobacteria bacterium]